ncbi:hypothetical protein QT979_24820 [Microcoleus sp. w2-18bC1]|uniref:hypothetical protein n=1 Tax=unclassified Microcoleus TaxID=2642155 RepID=UPI002FD0A686
MGLPIIVLHVGNSDYILYCLAQAKKTNPESPVIWLGDCIEKHYSFFDYENFWDYANEFQEFNSSYQHRSINGIKWELFCFQRWFVLKKLMQSRNIHQCLHIDSDVMLYANVTEEQKNFANCDLTLSQRQSPHYNFINNLNVLDSFCSFLLEMYKDPLIYQPIQEKFPNVSDMSAFYFFANRESFSIGEISNITNNSKNDHNINVCEGFEMREGRKNIYFVEDQPFCKHLELNRAIKFNMIHFQGWQTKKYIKDYFNGESIFRESREWEVNSHHSDAIRGFLQHINTEKCSTENSNLQENYTTLNFSLSEINVIVFPDWSAPEESLTLELERVLKAIAIHPDKNKITLLVDSSNISDEDANLALSSVALNLLMTQDLDVSDGPEILLIGQLSEIQWSGLKARIYGRIVLENENIQAIAAAGYEEIPSYLLDCLEIKATQ